jgi:hypothetical protein
LLTQQKIRVNPFNPRHQRSHFLLSEGHFAHCKKTTKSSISTSLRG